MHLSLKLLMPMGVLFFFSCNQNKNPHPGFKTTDTGLTYKFEIDEPGEAAKPGDRIVYHMSFRKGDSTVTSSYEQGYPVDVRLPEGVEEDFEGNYLLQALSMMSKGDSLTYVRLIDSIPANARPVAFEPGDYIYFDISMKDTQTKSEFEEEQLAYINTFEQTNSGLYYKFLKDIEGPSPKPEQGVRYDLTMKKHDITVYSTEDSGRPNGFQLPEASEIQKAVEENPILEAITMMSLGDSLSILFFSDSLQGALRPEWGFQSGDLVEIDLKLLEIKSKADIEKERAAAEALRSKEEKEREAAMKANEAIAKKVDEKVTKTLAQYKSGNLDVKKTESGLEYYIVEKGKGEKLKNGDRILVDYSGHLMDGTRFDASFVKGSPFPLTLGTGGVIKGWDEGLALMNAGDKAYLFIPPNLGYGEIGSPPRIPGNSDLVFYIEIKDRDM